MAAKAKNPGAKAGKRVVTTVEETVAEEQLGSELDLEPDTPDGDEGEDFLTVLGDLAGGSEARCEIRRTSPADFAGYCCTYPLSEMSLDRLQGEWGGGKFNVRVRNARGEFKGSTSIQIAGKPRHRDDTNAVPVVAVPAAPQQDLGAILKAAMDANKPQIDMLTSLVTALINKPVPAPPPPGPDTLEVIAALAPILKPDKGGGGDPADAVKLLMQGIELGKDLAGGGDGDSMLGLAGKGLDMVKTLAAQQPRRPVLPPPARRVPTRAPALAPPGKEPGTVSAQESAVPPADEVEVVNPQDPPMIKLLGWIKQQTQLLVYQAARGKDPQLYADLFLDNLPQGVSLETIHEQMSAPDALEKLAQVNPAVRQHPEWMERFRQAVLDGIGEDDEDVLGEADEGEIGEPTGDGGGES